MKETVIWGLDASCHTVQKSLENLECRLRMRSWRENTIYLVCIQGFTWAWTLEGYFWYWSITVFLIFRVLTITSYTSNLTLLHWTIYFELQHSSDRKVGQRVDSWQVYDWPPGHVPPLPCVLSSLIPYTRCCFLIMQIPLKHLWPKKRSTEWSS